MGSVSSVRGTSRSFADHVRREHNWAPEQRRTTGVAKTGLLSCALGALLVVGPCGVFFLSYNGFPPFQESDESGQQFEIRRRVPGTVRYMSGWEVTVDGPQESGPAAGADRVWLVPITVHNATSSLQFFSVATCQPSFDGHDVDPYFESAALRALGDVDNPPKLQAGDTATGRLAVVVPRDARTALLKCGRHAMTTATFDLTPFLARNP